MNRHRIMTLHCVNYFFFLLNRIETITVSITKDKNLARRNIALNIRTVLYLLSTVPTPPLYRLHLDRPVFASNVFSDEVRTFHWSRYGESSETAFARAPVPTCTGYAREITPERSETLGHGVNGPFVLLILFFFFLKKLPSHHFAVVINDSFVTR